MKVKLLKLRKFQDKLTVGLCFLPCRCKSSYQQSIYPQNMKEKSRCCKLQFKHTQNWGTFASQFKIPGLRDIPAGRDHQHQEYSQCSSPGFDVCFISGHQPFYIRASYDDIYGVISDLQMCSLLQFPF